MLGRLLGVCCALALGTIAMAQDAANSVYELRTYTIFPDKFDAAEVRFRDNTLRYLERHHIKCVGVYSPSQGDAARTTIMFVLEHESKASATKNWAAYHADPEYIASSKASEVNGKLFTKSPEVVYVTKADYSPEVTSPLKDKTYELRVYTAPEGKLDALHKRFHDHSARLLAKHKLPSIGYWKPVDAPASKNKLYYILECDNQEAAAASWKEFKADPEWVTALAESEKDGKLTTEVVSTFFKPTGYSPVRAAK